MAAPKTHLTKASALASTNSVKDPKRRKDGLALLKIFQEVTGEKPRMWGSSIVGFGSFHYKSERSSQEGDWPVTGFSPRKQALTVYAMLGLGLSADLLKKLGKYKKSVGCIYINKLEDIDIRVLKQIIKKSMIAVKKKYKV